MKKAIYIICLFSLLFLFISCSQDNPTPFLTSISPTSSVSNMPGFTLTLNGQHFVQGATVNFGSTVKSPDFISSSQLQCTIDTSDIQNISLQNKLDTDNLQYSAITVYVTNPSPGGGNSNSFTFNLADNYSFAAPLAISDSSDDSFYPQIALDSNNNINAVWQNLILSAMYDEISELKYSRSVDGHTWTSPIVISNNMRRARDPKISTGTSGEIYVVWEGFIPDKNYIFFTKSMDNGATWREPLNITENSYWPREPAIAIDPLGKIFIVYLESGIRFINSTDNGESFSAPSMIIDSFSISNPQIAVDSMGRIYVTYSQGGWGDSVTACTISQDGGVTWSTPREVTIGRQCSEDPDLALDPDGNINIVWEQSDLNSELNYHDNEIFYSRSTDHGATWSVPVNISQTSTDSLNPSITIDSLRNINISWTESISIREKIYTVRSTDNGATWSGIVDIYGNAVGFAGVDTVMDSFCNLYLVWVSYSIKTEIYFIRSNSSGQTFNYSIH